MTAFIDWLNANAGVLTLCFSAVVTCATVAYVVLTRSLVVETKKMREAQAQPHVAIRVQTTPVSFGFADLVVENLGSGPAYDVTFEVLDDLEIDAADRHLSDVGFIKYGLSYMAPGKSLSSYIVRLMGLDEEKLAGPEKISATIQVNYRGVFGNSFGDRFELDFAQFANLVQLGSPPLPQLAKELTKIREKVDRFASGFSRLKVITYTSDEVRREYEERRQQVLESGAEAEDSSPKREPEAT